MSRDINAIFVVGAEDDPFAIVIRQNAKVQTIKFFSPLNSPQQIGLMSRPAGYVVQAHTHNEVVRTISITQEVLVIRKGACKVRIFDSALIFVEEISLVAGDTILLARGGHEIVMTSDCEILEVKQGPYSAVEDKTHFKAETE